MAAVAHRVALVRVVRVLRPTLLDPTNPCACALGSLTRHDGSPVELPRDRDQTPPVATPLSHPPYGFQLELRRECPTMPNAFDGYSIMRRNEVSIKSGHLRVDLRPGFGELVGGLSHSKRRDPGQRAARGKL